MLTLRSPQIALRTHPISRLLTTPKSSSPTLYLHHARKRHTKRTHDPQSGTTTPLPAGGARYPSGSPFYFESAWSGWPKRPPRPFPPPFFSPPSGSFSDPLSTHDRVRGDSVKGQPIRGRSVGDDAVISEDNFIGANDGVGAWAQKERGCAPLWSRLILHFWVLSAEKHGYGREGDGPEPVRYLDEAYALTKEVLTEAKNYWEGTTTASAALLHHEGDRPVLFVTQLGDSKVLVIRPREEKVIFTTEEQWHFFDCPRQLGTNSPDTPYENAVMTRLEIEEDDVVLALSDGVTDNLWEHEVCASVVESLKQWREKHQDGMSDEDDMNTDAQAMKRVARDLVDSARKIAEDMFAESPFMERAVEEGMPYEGGKLDDISVVAGLCKKRSKG